MSQAARLDAYRKFEAARTMYGADVLADPEEGCYPNVIGYGASSATTNISATSVREVTVLDFKGPITYVARGPLKPSILPNAYSTVTSGAVITAPLKDTFFDYLSAVLGAEIANQFVEPRTTSAQIGLLTGNFETPTAHATAFAELDERRAGDNEVTNLIAKTRSSLSWCYAERVACQLAELQDAADEEGPETAGISTESLNTFYQFLDAHPELACPKLALTPDGFVYAQWRTDKQRLLSVQFLPTGDARFVIFRPNPKHPDKTIRLTALTTVDMLIDEIHRHQIEGWVLE